MGSLSYWQLRAKNRPKDDIDKNLITTGMITGRLRTTIDRVACTKRSERSDIEWTLSKEQPKFKGRERF